MTTNLPTAALWDLLSFRSGVPCLLLCLLLGVFCLAGCGSQRVDLETVAIQTAIDAGGIVKFPPGTYVFSKTLVVRKSGTVIEGSGEGTVFVFKRSGSFTHCVNDRAFTTPCDVADTPRRRIASAIAKGDISFTASGDTADLVPGDWLIVNEKDNTVKEIVVVDWVQVAGVTGHRVQVTAPFRTTFPNTHAWDPTNGGLSFYKVPTLVQNVEFRNFTLVVPDSGIGMSAISVYGSQNVTIDNVSVQNKNGQALYSYIAKGLTIQNSSGDSGKRTNEFAASVDLQLDNNRFSSDGNAGFGLDFGSAFFRAEGNIIPTSVNSGVYVLYGVHDGAITNNVVDFVHSNGNAVGILARGSTNLSITDNTLVGGAGDSTGISVGPQYGFDVFMPSFGNIIAPNTFGSGWTREYDVSDRP